MELVIDTSVVLKWFFEEEEGADLALRYRDRHVAGELTLLAPALLSFEVANALATKTKVSEAEFQQALASFYFTGIKEVPLLPSAAENAVRLARQYKLSAYDASYLALAQEVGCRFLTADAKLYRAVKSLGFVEQLK